MSWGGGGGGWPRPAWLSAGWKRLNQKSDMTLRHLLIFGGGEEKEEGERIGRKKNREREADVNTCTNTAWPCLSAFSIVGRCEKKYQPKYQFSHAPSMAENQLRLSVPTTE